MQSTPRPVNKVIDQIIRYIPKNEIILIEALDKYKKELVYSAPELLISEHCWCPFLDILNKHINKATEQWHIEIANIINVKEC